jgi:hypothetical protein
MAAGSSAFIARSAICSPRRLSVPFRVAKDFLPGVRKARVPRPFLGKASTRHEPIANLYSQAFALLDPSRIQRLACGMALKWLWQSLVANWIWYVLAVLASAAVGWLATEGSKWIHPILYTLGTFVLILVAFASIKGAQAAFAARAYFEQQARTGVTVDNVEGLVREWSDTFRFSVKKLNAKDSYHWAFELRGPAEIPITVMRSRDLSHYLTVIGSLTVAGEHPELFKTLKRSDADALIAQLRI